MGFFDSWGDGASVISRRSSHHHHSSSHRKHHKSRSRSRSRTRHSGIFGESGSHGHHHNRSKSSFFSLPNVSSRSFFGLSKPSYYKRTSRPSFINRAYKKLKRLLRDLVYYAKRHPLKVFMLVIMPLLTGGALTALLARFGIRMPAGLERMLGVGAKAMTGDGIGLVGEAVRMAGGLGGAGSVHLERGRSGGLQWERRSVDREEGGGWGGFGGLGSLGNMAKMFM